MVLESVDIGESVFFSLLIYVNKKYVRFLYFLSR